MTETPAEIPTFPDVSYALHVNRCEPGDFREFQVFAYGALLSLDLKTPSTYKSTLLMGLLEVTLTATVTLPDTVAPADGEVIATVGPLGGGGGVGSGAGGLKARPTALAALTRPQPKLGSQPGVPRSSLDCFTIA